MGDRYYSTSTAFLEALADGGIRYMFANLGSDHPGLIEALAQARVEDRRADLPELIICPHETVALSAAHAYAAVTREPQAVLVHVDSGTQNLGGAVNNAFRGRVPVLIFAGSAPYTLEGELPGSRNEFIHWVQDVHDQRGILRSYVKYDNEIRTGRNVKQLVHRALQISATEPAGPVYLVGPREVMEEQLDPYTVDPSVYHPVEPAALSPDLAGEIGRALARARNPLIVTGYLGRHPEAVPELEALADLLAIPVIESAPHYMNFPASHPMHSGYQWTTKDQNPVLAEADVILAIDSDVPWIPVTSKPAADAEIYCVDIDPLKSGMPMWHIPARRFAAADSRLALPQITAYVRDHNLVDEALVNGRRADVTARHDMLRAERDQREQPDNGAITPQYLAACVREALADDDPLFLTEAITNYEVVAEHLRVNRPGALIGSGGGSLGWAGGERSAPSSPPLTAPWSAWSATAATCSGSRPRRSGSPAATRRPRSRSSSTTGAGRRRSSPRWPSTPRAPPPRTTTSTSASSPPPTTRPSPKPPAAPTPPTSPTRPSCPGSCARPWPRSTAAAPPSSPPISRASEIVFSRVRGR